MLSEFSDLEIYDNFNRQRNEKNCFYIDKINEEIGYEVFIKNYLIPNIPCLFGPWVTKSNILFEKFFK